MFVSCHRYTDATTLVVYSFDSDQAQKMYVYVVSNFDHFEQMFSPFNIRSTLSISVGVYEIWKLVSVCVHLLGHSHELCV